MLKNSYSAFYSCIVLASLFASNVCLSQNLSPLKTNGTSIVDSKGARVILRGVNFGGWLVEEMWMMPFETKPPKDSKFNEVKDHVSLWRTIEQRFGKVRAAELRTSLRNNWITPEDFDRVKKAGMNCIRVPFTVDLFEEEDGFKWLDRALALAKERKLYVILDMHGAYERQSGEHHTGEAGIDRFFKSPAAILKTAELWAKIAKRYRANTELVGYDLLNEPSGVGDSETLYKGLDRLFKAIRAVDSQHIIIVEDGYKGMQSLPDPTQFGWKNVVYSTHHYNFDAKSFKDQVDTVDGHVVSAEAMQKSRKVPYFVGEFQLEPWGSPEAMAKFTKTLTEHNLSWTVWTFKTCMKDGGGGMWGWYRSPKASKALNPFTDSFETLNAKLKQLRTENLTEDVMMTAAFRQSGK